MGRSICFFSERLNRVYLQCQPTPPPGPSLNNKGIPSKEIMDSAQKESINLQLKTALVKNQNFQSSLIKQPVVLDLDVEISPNLCTHEIVFGFVPVNHFQNMCSFLPALDTETCLDKTLLSFMPSAQSRSQTVT